ncbi:RDD family protein [Nocardia lasii]|uniref:RDD family protein n=1 Tax=Nocardia lasii TaxID=1616107 RepID=A0ABW1JP82_9NOCA
MSDQSRVDTTALERRYGRRADGSLRLGRRADDPPDRFRCDLRAEGPRAGIVPAFLVDVVSHLAIGVAVWWALDSVGSSWALPVGFLAWIGASFTHRVVVQRHTHTTAGKALFGLRLRHPDGSHPRFGCLLRLWTVAALSTFTALLTP